MYPGDGALVLPLDLWRSPRHGDETVVTRCLGPTLDVGCGPGRMVHAVAANGVPALGIDISPLAVEQARARGASALRRDVFGPLPAVGRWHHVLLIDGNIGIGADPAALLRRCREFLQGDGTVLVELEPSRAGVSTGTLRLVADGVVSLPLPWARVGADAIGHVARSAGMYIVDRWTEGGRAFAELRVRWRRHPAAAKHHSAAAPKPAIPHSRACVPTWMDT